MKSNKAVATFALPILSVIGLIGLSACSEPTVIEPVQRRATVKPIPKDSIGGLIDKQQSPKPKYTFPNNTVQPDYDIAGLSVRNPSFEYWLETHPYQKQQVALYQNYLSTQLRQVPPMDQLVLSARDAVSCGYEPYEVPPRELWSNIIPTLQLLERLKQQGYLPRTTIIRSVYRNPSLNACAGGASESKHLTNGAIDIWIPEYDGDKWAVEQTFDSLCQFWQTQGQQYNLGLGLYATGAIHLDTQGYRKWGANHASASSPCRF